VRYRRACVFPRLAVLLSTVLVGAIPAQGTPARVFAPNLARDSQVSSNWAGYALTGTGTAGAPVAFTNITASWVQPNVSCASGESYSAFWVGLGGFSPTSEALEQIGTEANCNARGVPVYGAWYEIVPEPSIPIRMRIAPGDRIVAAVLVQGTQVTLQITNTTRHVRVTKRLTVEHPDLTSAEWIAEAPSECTSSGRCDTLPLARFGGVSFTRAAATGDGHAGTITDAAWSATPIELSEDSPAPLDGLLPHSSAGSSGAVPGTVSPDGRSFAVTWHPAA
jgi:hypothetical protein